MARAFRYLRASLLACTVALASATSASADHGAPLLDETVSAYVGTAQEHWGGASPSCVAADGAVVPVHAALFDDPDPEVAARAEQPGCRIWLDRDFWPAPPTVRACVEITHEWGHMLGHGHAARGVMSSHALAVVPGCSVFRPRQQQRRLARSGSLQRGPRGCARGFRGARAGCRPLMVLG